MSNHRKWLDFTANHINKKYKGKPLKRIEEKCDLILECFKEIFGALEDRE